MFAKHCLDEILNDDDLKGFFCASFCNCFVLQHFVLGKDPATKSVEFLDKFQRAFGGSATLANFDLFFFNGI